MLALFLAACGPGGNLGPGEACEEDGDCLSGICLEEGGGKHCSLSGVETTEYPGAEIPAPAGRRIEVVAGSAAVSLMVYVEGDGVLYYALSGLTAPDGTVLLDDQLRGINPVFPAKGIFTALVPDTDLPEGAIQTGTYTFDVIAFDDDGLVVPSIASIRVMVKRRGDGSPAGGTLDLHLFIAGGARTGLDASTAAGDPEIQAAVDRFEFYYTVMGGIDVGTVHYYDIPAGYAVIDSEEELGRMLALSSMAEGGGLAIFLAASLEGLPGSPGGQAGGIPGPPDIRGTFRSGVAVALTGDVERTADSLCHEAGHYLGLFHTSETYSDTHETFHDPISDTPECTLGTLEDFDTCPARTNLMFPQPSILRDELTAGQAFVCNNNVMVQ